MGGFPGVGGTGSQLKSREQCTMHPGHMQCTRYVAYVRGFQHEHWDS